MMYGMRWAVAILLGIDFWVVARAWYTNTYTSPITFMWVALVSVIAGMLAITIAILEDR